MTFLGIEAEEVLFGGAAGGGKSDALLMAAAQYVDVPGYAAGLFRLTKLDMLKPDAILARANAWFTGTAAWWSPDEHAWKFPTSGEPATIHFGYVAHQKDLDRYQGAAFQFVGIDEAGQWPEYNYRYLFSRLRRPKGMRAPIRMRASANPGGTGHDWIKDRFIEYAKHIGTGTDARADIKAFRHSHVPLPEPSIYASPPSLDAQEVARLLGVEAQPSYFVPSFKEHNIGLDVQAYAAQLGRLDPTTRAQLDGGDWDASHNGNYFKAEWFKIVDEAPAGLHWVRSWDFAATEEEKGVDPDWTVGSLCAIEQLENNEKRFWIADIERFREEPGPTEATVKQTARNDGKRVTVLMEQEPGSAGKTVAHGYKTRILPGWSVVSMRKTGPKAEYWRLLSSLAHAGNVYLVKGSWNSAFIKEMKDLPGQHDDQADSASQCFAYLTDEEAAAMDRLRATAKQ